MTHRFAPSPTGYLHLGHAFSALTAWDQAKANDADFLLRVEDIDTARSRPDFEAAIFEDLHWLGLSWPESVLRQSQRLGAYEYALKHLIKNDLVYPCNCTRRDISEALSAPQEDETNRYGPDGAIYPGTCRHRDIVDKTGADSLRIDMKKAVDYLGGPENLSSFSFHESGEWYEGKHFLNADQLTNFCGDVVLARRDIGTSYHLAVVVDDGFQQISQATRGEDMFETTQIHRLLQALLGLKTPKYHHHRLIRDETGKRLAKRDDARAIRKFRQDGAVPSDIRRLVGL